MSDKTELVENLRDWANGYGSPDAETQELMRLLHSAADRITAIEAENARLRAMLERASPFLHDEGDKWEDDGSNEPLELARDIDAVLASVSSDESALPSANLVLDGGTDAAYPCPHADEAACDCDSPPSRSIDAARGEKGQ